MAQSLAHGRCQDIGFPCSVVPDLAVQAERRIAHESTGIVTRLDMLAIQAILDQHQLAIVGFGGQDDRHRFLHVPSVSLATDMAVELRPETAAANPRRWNPRAKQKPPAPAAQLRGS